MILFISIVALAWGLYAFPRHTIRGSGIALRSSWLVLLTFITGTKALKAKQSAMDAEAFGGSSMTDGKAIKHYANKFDTATGLKDIRKEWRKDLGDLESL
jgi:hypothetical protein